MNIVILGPQGSGKGTQAKLLVEKLNLYYFDMGKFLRREAQHNKMLDKYVNIQGKFVPSEISSPLALEFIANENKERDNILFDGFPRSVEQLKYVDEWLEEKKKNIDVAILVEISEKESIERLSNRRVCSKCGTIYNLVTNPPPESGCMCGGNLTQREDDIPKAIKERLSWYNDLVGPLLDKYKERKVLININGERPIDVIHKDIMSRIEKLNK